MRVKEDLEEASFSTLTSREPPRNQQNIASGVGTGSVPIASNNNTAALCREIRIVRDLIERCLLLFLDKDEVVKTLFEQARIQPDFTRIVWNRLEQENAEFFKAYCTMLILKKQISVFNELLEKQHHLLNYAAPLEYPLAPMQEGIQHMPFIKSEIPSPVSFAPHDQYPFVPREMPESVDPSAFDFSELSHVQNPGQVLLQPANAGFHNLADIGEYSVSTGLRDPS
ncbi:hypothetical protein NC651_028192 [Populus alba x Populus x berolinensis]|nr:hypothetical protein NC651_028192 [Populus alba x Populus x berolinensis]